MSTTESHNACFAEACDLIENTEMNHDQVMIALLHQFPDVEEQEIDEIITDIVG